MPLLSPRAIQAQTYVCATLLNVQMTCTPTATTRLRRPNIDRVPAAGYSTLLASTRTSDGKPRSLDRIKRKRLRVIRSACEPPSPSQPPAVQVEEELTWADFENARPDAPGSLEGPVQTLQSICKLDSTIDRYSETHAAYHIFLRDMHLLFKEVYGGYKPEPRSSALNEESLAEALKEERQHPFDHRESASEKQWERYIAMINGLVDDLVKQAYIDEVPGDPELARRNIESLDSAWTAIRLLRSEGYPGYMHPLMDRKAANEAREKLSQTLDELFKMNQEKITIKPKFLVAKICYNLLVCEFPPSIHHFNTLILGFSRLGMHNLVDLVVVTVLQSRLRATTHTVNCLLHHYRKIGDVQGFFSIMRRLTGQSNKGLLLTRRKLGWREEWEPGERYFALFCPRVVWRGRRHVSHFYAVQLHERTADIYEAIITGLLAFARTKDAIKALHACLKEDIDVSAHLIHDVFHQSFFMLDAAVHNLLFRVVLDCVDFWKQFLYGRDPDITTREWLWSLIVSHYQFRTTSSSNLTQELSRASKWMFIPRDHSSPLELQTLQMALFLLQSEHKLTKLDTILHYGDELTSAVLRQERLDIATKMIEKLDRLQYKDVLRFQRARKNRKLFRLTTSLKRMTWHLGKHNVQADHKRVVDVLRSSLPLPGWSSVRPEAYEERLEQLADNWLRHRLRQREAITGPVIRLVAEIEVSLYYGERLKAQCLEMIAPHASPYRPKWTTDHRHNHKRRARTPSMLNDAWSNMVPKARSAEELEELLQADWVLQFY